MNDPLSFYQEQLNTCETQAVQLKKKLFNLGLLRLTAFLAAVLCFYFYYDTSELIFLVAGILSILIFFYGIRKYADTAYKKSITEKLVFINKNEVTILNGGINGFDNGANYETAESYYTDLDVFGDRSLYHLLNRTATGIGRDTLATYLKNSITEKDKIRSIQEAVKELKDQSFNRQLLIAKGLLYQYNTNDATQINDWLKEKEVITSNKWMNIARWILPVAGIITLAYWIITGNYLPFLATAIVNWLHIGKYAKLINRQHQLMGKKQDILDQYAAIIECFTDFTIKESAFLKELKELSVNASQQIKSLSRISNFFDQRLNVLVNIVLNSVMLYDLQCLFQLEKWKLTNKEKFPQWVKALGEIEYLNSIAGFAYNNPGYCWPEVAEGNPFIEATAMAHPLISETERVSNNFVIGKEEKLQLVTGSNMSGKTTFLRSAGVNVLLAQCGAPVCASSFLFVPLQILSSIRISDSLQEHTSYFMAELKKLHHIVQSLHSGKPSLVLIDEILRGTNSDDKTHGSEQFIKKILSTNCLTLFATHDLSLGVMENEYPGSISNYCFESIIQNNELRFDYLLRKGIAQNKNASFLMKKMEII